MARTFKITMTIIDRECEDQTLKEIKNSYENEVFDNGYDIDFKIDDIIEINQDLATQS